VAAFEKRHRIDYPVVASDGDESLPAPFSRVESLPTLFFVERDGTIRSIVEGSHDYDYLESRLRIGDAAEHWARKERDQALKLAAQALETHLDEPTGDDLYAVFGDDPDFAALHDRVTSRITGLLDYYQRNHDRHFAPTRAAVVWEIWSLGAEHKDAEAVPLLVRFLRESAIEEIRWRAADALWAIGNRRAVPELIAALRDPSLKVAASAASALGELGDRTAVGPLLELFHELTDNRDEAKARVAYALGRLGDPRAAAPIAASLQRIRDPAYVRWAAPAAERLRKAARQEAR
jgi:hypothetical protein